MPTLSIRDLCVQLSGKVVLHDLALDVAPGQVVCIIGPNGSGKSTLLRAVAGLVPPHVAPSLGTAQCSPPSGRRGRGWWRYCRSRRVGAAR